MFQYLPVYFYLCAANQNIINTMKQFFSAILLLAVFASCEGTKKASDEIKLLSSTDSVSYALGVNIGESLKQQGLDSLNTELVMKAMDQSFANDTTMLMNNEKSLAYLNEYFQKMQQAKMAAALEEGKAFLAENAKKPGVTTTASGLQYEVITQGTGKMPVDGEKVVVNYTGKLIDGTEFDSTVGKSPLTYPVNKFVAGWQEALKLMKVGSKYHLVIPSELGYGQMGGGVIPPNSVLIFDLELLDVLPGDPVPSK